MLERSLYDICLCAGFGGDSCTGTAILITDALSETTLGYGAAWGTRTGYFRVSFDGGVN